MTIDDLRRHLIAVAETHTAIELARRGPGRPTAPSTRSRAAVCEQLVVSIEPMLDPCSAGATRTNAGTNDALLR